MSAEQLMQECHGALSSPNMQAFLRVIRAGETSQGDEAYRMIVGGGLFDSFDDHPRKLVHIASLGVNSTAAGAYQFLSRTWDGCAKALELPDFSPAMQDIAAVYLIRGRGALQDVIAGRLDVAIAKCAREWASLPGSPYGQPTRSMAQAKATYEQYGGAYAQTSEEEPPRHIPFPFPLPDQPMLPGDAGDAPEFNTMPLPAILGALLPHLIEGIPKLAKIFGPGSAVAERNVKAAELAMQIAQQAIGATNAQETVEKIKADPAAAATVTQAIEARWFELAESGGGGIDGARKSDAAAVASGEPVWRSPSFVMGCLLLPLVYLIVGNVTGLYGVEWAPEARAGIAGSLAGGIVMGIIGYYFGQTTSRNRTPAP